MCSQLSVCPRGEWYRGVVRHPPLQVSRHPPGKQTPPKMATAAIGTHPTEMHSCFYFEFTHTYFGSFRKIHLILKFLVEQLLQESVIYLICLTSKYRMTCVKKCLPPLPAPILSEAGLT